MIFMIIIGIDPGTAETGLGIIKANGQGITLVHHCCIKTKVSVSKPLRLEQIFKQVLEKINQFKAESLAIEKLFFNTNAKSASAVGQAMGAVMLAAAKARIEVFEYSPLAIKKNLTGYGWAKKPELQKAVRKVLKIREIPRPQHAADALAAAICHYKVLSLK
jgi:crossover junction endodeoxyribonuclease RuvC